MDFLLEASESIQKDVFFSVANLFNIDVDLLFLDTTTTYFETMQEDEDRNLLGFHIGSVDVEEVKKDLNGWKLNGVVMVQDTGFNSERNKKVLQSAGGHYIMGEKMRLGPNGSPAVALKAKGRYKTMENGLEVKDITINKKSEARRRYILVRNPKEAERDKKKRNNIIEEVKQRLEELKQLEGEPHEKAAFSLRAHSTYDRYIRQTKTGHVIELVYRYLKHVIDKIDP